MGLPTASNLTRAILCPCSESLPHFDTIGVYSQAGNAIHAYLADPEHKLPDGEFREACENIDLDALPKGDWAAEVAFAWDYETDAARELGRNLGRKYPETRPTEYIGTADVVGLTEDAAIVLDWKSGYGDLPRENWQLRALALFAARAYGRSAAQVAIVRTWAPDRIRPQSFDALDLAGFASELKAMPMAWSNAPRLVQGDHCTYCPAFASCPAKLALFRQAIDLPTIDETNAAALYVKTEAVAQILGKLRAGLAMYAKEHPITLPNGNIYGPVQKSRESIEPFVALSVLTELHGAIVAQAAMEMKTSKAGIERALAQVAEKGKKASMVREALAAIEAKDGIMVKHSEAIEEHRGTLEQQEAAGRKVLIETADVPF